MRLWFILALPVLIPLYVAHVVATMVVYGLAKLFEKLSKICYDLCFYYGFDG